MTTRVLTAKLAAVFCLLLPALRAAADPMTVTLPSADTYFYWVQSKDGPVSVPPAAVHKKVVQIAAPVTTGDTLFVMDGHNGAVAQRRVSIGLSGAPLPAAFTLADFRFLIAAPPPPPAPTAPLPAAATPPAPPAPSGFERLATGLVSLALAGGVGWLVLHLVRTRGESLRRLARRAGIEVADPDGGTGAEQEPPVYSPARRAPEAVPDSAGRPPDLPLSSSSLGRGPALPLSDIPALLGVQGLAAGSTFALTGGDVTIGRDGDNEVVLAENTVSRRHARIVRDGRGQFTVSDLGSANGVYLNGTRVQRAILASGDEIKIGDNYFRFQAAKENP